MSTQVQFRRGTTTQNNAFTGAIGEISVDTDLKTIRLHDGTTAGGGSVMLNNVSAQTALNKTFSTGSSWQGNAVALAYGGTGSSLTAAAGAVAYSTSGGLALTAAGTSGQLLVSGGTGAPTWVAASSISAGTSTLAATATNIAGGSAGQLIIQADTGLSTFITAGAAGTFLRSAGAGYAPTWATADVTIGTTVISLGSASTTLAGLSSVAISGSTASTGTTSGALTVVGGVGIGGALNVGGNTIIGGNLTVNGTTITANSANTSYADSLLELNYSNGGTLTSDNGKDIGLRMHYFKGSDKNAALVFGNDSTQMEYYADGTETNGVFSGTYGYYKAKGFNHQDLFLHDSFTATTSGTSANTIYSFPIATYRSGEFTLQIKNGTTYRIAKFLVVHDGTTASITSNYLTDSDLQTGNTNTTISATISAGNLLLQATVSSGITVVKGSATIFTV
jgi:hypothetical protein